MGTSRSVCVGLMMFSARILSISAFSNFCGFGPARCGVECICAVSKLQSLMRCFA